ncbi:MAG: ABC transporter permease [Clostridiales bacterium]|jgi:putative ABC transport system permease protein|nr:ABC transporter permease [Clostridiales bacterium]
MIWENIQLAFSSLKSNKMRALLTMLGIIIGIMSIITIVIIGDAMSATVTEDLSQLGGNNVTLNLQEKSERSVSYSIENGRAVSYREYVPPESGDMISDGMISGLKAAFPEEITGVSVSVNGGSARAQDGELYANISVTGTNADYFLANNLTVLSGRLISEDDVRENAQTAVVSNKLAGKMFPDGSDPVGQQVKVYKTYAIELYTIIGVYEYEQSAFTMSNVADEDITTQFYIPVSTATQDNLEKNYYSATVVITPGEDVAGLTTELQRYFDDLYFNNANWGVNVFNMSSILETVTETLGTISVAIAFIAGISLVVGGIGVMNIMLVSVTERTREIGTRKALGAKNFHIQFQFVTEALIIALVGGVIGLVLGIALGAAAAAVFGAKLVISPPVVAGSVLFSMLIGVFFGLYPANKAAKLDPIDALRYE